MNELATRADDLQPDSGIHPARCILCGQTLDTPGCYAIKGAQLAFLWGAYTHLVAIEPDPPAEFAHRCESIDCLQCWNQAQHQIDLRQAVHQDLRPLGD